jgi:beta-lactamase regulating signal transducer with metallopeptidase domain
MIPSTHVLGTLFLRATAVMAPLTLIVFLLGRASAATRHAVLRFAIGGLLLLPLLTATLPRLDIAVLPDVPREAMPPEPLAQAPIVFGAVEPETTRLELEPVAAATSPASPPRLRGTDGLALIWAAGASIGILRVFVGLLVVARMTRRARVVTEGSWPSLLAELAPRMGVRRRVSLVESDRVSVPIVWGFWRPTIVLPAGAASWPSSRTRAFLAHELAHVGRGDGGWLVVAGVARALYWPHPLVWWAQRRLRTEAERASDDRVLDVGVEAQGYAQELLEAARSLGRAPRPLAVVAIVERRSLEDRLRAILDPAMYRRPLGRRAALATSGVAGALVGLAALAQPVARATALETIASAPAPVSTGARSVAPPATPAPRATAPASNAAPARPAAVPSPATVAPAPAPTSAPQRKRDLKPPQSAEEAAELERRLVERPEEIGDPAAIVDAHKRLAAYYRPNSPDGHTACLRHLLWLVEHAPDDHLVVDGAMMFASSLSMAMWAPEAYARLRKAWLDQVERRHDDAAVMGNAARFFTLSERGRAKELYRRALALPLSPHETERLARRLDVLEQHDATDKRQRGRTFDSEAAIFEDQWTHNRKEAAAKGTRVDIGLLEHVTAVMYAVGDYDKARAYADELLAFVAQHPDMEAKEHDRALQAAHRILGDLALEAGDADGAQTHFIAGMTALRTPY